MTRRRRRVRGRDTRGTRAGLKLDTPDTRGSAPEIEIVREIHRKLKVWKKGKTEREREREREKIVVRHNIIIKNTIVNIVYLELIQYMFFFVFFGCFDCVPHVVLCHY